MQARRNGETDEGFAREAMPQIKEIYLQWSHDRNRNSLEQDTFPSDPETPSHLGVADLPLESVLV